MSIQALLPSAQIGLAMSANRPNRKAQRQHTTDGGRNNPSHADRPGGVGNRPVPPALPLVALTTGQETHKK